jgi:hypothetical protein
MEDVAFSVAAQSCITARNERGKVMERGEVSRVLACVTARSGPPISSVAPCASTTMLVPMIRGQREGAEQFVRLRFYPPVYWEDGW